MAYSSVNVALFHRLAGLISSVKWTYWSIIYSVLVAIDECQYLNIEILRDFKMLLNQEYDSMDCFALIMVGLPHMNSILEKPIHEALKQRIVVHYNYCGLSAEETSDYIYSRIESAGGARSIIDEAAVRAIAGYCQGTPRVINSIMTNALLLGAQLNKQSIDSEIILDQGFVIDASHNLYDYGSILYPGT